MKIWSRVGLVWMATCLSVWAQTEQSAYTKAQTAVTESQRHEVLSIYGKGDASTIQEWFVTFADPTATSKGKTIVVKAGQIDRVNPSLKTQDPSLAFDPALVKVGAAAALTQARQYAEKNAIRYDTTRVLLRRPQLGEAPVWRVELKQGEVSKGAIYLTSPDGVYARYEAPTVAKRSRDDSAAGFFKDVEHAFTGAGGDMEEFFTGDRTVDR